MMIPYFHFTGGDNLLFSAWKPSSPGVIGGACVGVFFLAILDRFLAAVRTICEVRWHQRRETSFTYSSPAADANLEVLKTGIIKESRAAESTSPLDNTRQTRIQRSILPFISAHDIPRGVLHSVQALFGYVLMLVVMTFNMSYIIAIIIGLGVGEILFVRLGRLGGRIGGH
ncbi:copper transporter [Cyathus striatus]|nr:copper transporter [Cyathus striatus]